MDFNPIIKQTLILKSKSKLSIYNTIQQKVVHQIAISSSDPILEYHLTSSNNKILLIYVLNSGILNIFNVDDLQSLFAKKVCDDVKKVSANSETVALLNGAGTVKLFDILTFEIKKEVKVGSSSAKSCLLIDTKSKNLIYNSNNSVYVHNIKSDEAKEIYTVSEKINYVKLSNDRHSIIVSSNIYFVNIIDFNGSPQATLQLSQSASNIKLFKIASGKKDKVVKHLALCYNNTHIVCYYYIGEPTTYITSQTGFEIQAGNLIAVNFDEERKTISAYYGDLSRVNSKTLSLFDKSNELKTGIVLIKSTEGNKESQEKESQINSNYKVLNDSDIYNNNCLSSLDLENNEFFETNKNSKLASNSKGKTKLEDKGVTILDSFNSALANNDNDRFDWVVSQNVNVDSTVKLLSIEQIESFLSKACERFNSKVQKGIVIWLESIFRHHFSILPVNQLKKLEALIIAKTMNYSVLLETQAKIELLSDLKSTLVSNDQNKITKSKKQAENKEIKPLLVYYESDDENEKKLEEKIKILSKNSKKSGKANGKSKAVSKAEDLDMDIDDLDADDVDYISGDEIEGDNEDLNNSENGDEDFDD